MQRTAARTRNASVEVSNFHRRVRGTGTYYTFNGHDIVITAAHVVDGDSPIMGVLTPSGEHVLSYIVFFNIVGNNDIAVLLLDSPLESRVPMDLNPREASGDLIGEPMVYTGNPGHHEQLTIFGTISGFSGNKSIIMHSYAWGGASGSNIFDNKGRLIGILKATDLNRNRLSPFPQITEDIVWVAPISGLSVERLSVILEIQRLIIELE